MCKKELIFVLFTNSKRQAKGKCGHIIVAVNKTLNPFSDETKTRNLQGAIDIFNSLMYVTSFIWVDFPRAEVFLVFVNSD